MTWFFSILLSFLSLDNSSSSTSGISGAQFTTKIHASTCSLLHHLTDPCRQVTWWRVTTDSDTTLSTANLLTDGTDSIVLFGALHVADTDSVSGCALVVCFASRACFKYAPGLAEGADTILLLFIIMSRKQLLCTRDLFCT